jgi:hypothetical protein
MKKNYLIFVILFLGTLSSCLMGAASRVTVEALQATKHVYVAGMRFVQAHAQGIILDDAITKGHKSLKRVGRPPKELRPALKIEVLASPFQIQDKPLLLGKVFHEGFSFDPAQEAKSIHMIAVQQDQKKLAKVADSLTDTAKYAAINAYFTGLNGGRVENAEGIITKAAIKAGIATIKRVGRPSSATLKDLEQVVLSEQAKLAAQAKMAIPVEVKIDYQPSQGWFSRLIWGSNQA